MYLAVPIVLYGCERLIRAFRSSIKPVKILKVINFPLHALLSLYDQVFIYYEFLNLIYTYTVN